jgi:integrase
MAAGKGLKSRRHRTDTLKVSSKAPHIGDPYLRRQHPEIGGTVFHATRKWFITQCERTGVPEHFTATLVGHQSARSENKLTYGLYSAGISDTQKRKIIDQIRLPQDVLL